MGDAGRVDPDVVVSEEAAEVVDGGWVWAVAPGVLGDVEETHVSGLSGRLLETFGCMMRWMCRWVPGPRLEVSSVY